MRPFKQCTLRCLLSKPFLNPQKLGSVFVCTFTGRVQQGRLKRDHLNVVQVFIDGHLNSKTGVWVHIGKGQQVRGTHKEVSMERVDGKTCRGKEVGGGVSTFKMQQLLPPKVESCTCNDGLTKAQLLGWRTFAAAYSHDSLKANLPAQISFQVLLEALHLSGAVLVVVGGVVVDASCRVSGYTACRKPHKWEATIRKFQVEWLRQSPMMTSL